ncbi:hypothetical protein RYH80_05635 [Halobaculum sp. MBLA0147]|uniref:hypothetical protein n=1 Tax=Halobaculum sp. MBLA0147 TaxID=3079934 RepID=UPI003524553A
MTDDVEARLDALADRLDELEAENERLREENEELRGRVDQLQRDNAELRSTVAEIESRPRVGWDDAPDPSGISVVAPEGDHEWDLFGAIHASASKDVVADLDERVQTVMDAVESGELEDQGETKLGLEPETPLEELCACPDTIQRQATRKVDVYRAVKFAEELWNRSEKLPNGDRHINSSDLSRWLASRFDEIATTATGERANSTTVGRVRRALSKFGKDRIEVTEKKGRGHETKIVVNAELADRCQKFGNANVDASIVNELNAVDAGNHDPVTG